MPSFRGFERSIPQKANKELQVFAYVYTQGVTANWFPENDFLKGQIVGRLYGANTTSTSDTITGFYAEQRLLPFLVYSPKLFDGKLTLRTSFEIDWTWGDVAYGVGGNFGSAFAADQVNLQTQNVEMEYVPHKNWKINIGLQRLFDTPHDPYRTLFDKMTYTGYRLMYWGSDAVGVSVRQDKDYFKWKAGAYKLYENNVELNDDVTLLEWNGQKNLNAKWNAGASVYYLRDNSAGKGGVSILGQGLTSTLTLYNGTFRFPLGADPYTANVFWVGGFFSRNEDMMQDPWTLSGFVNYNLGTVHQRNAASVKRKSVTINGLGANLKAGYRYGQTAGDAIIGDLYFSSGDADGINDGRYEGVMTGNTWGSPGGLFIGSGSYLLFPQGNVVNRFVAAVTDFSNMGLGLFGGTLQVNHDFIPHKFHSRLGVASAWSAVTPAGTGNNHMGWELNGKLGYDLGAFFTIEAHAAYLWLGDFYLSPAVNGGIQGGNKPVNPFQGFVCVKWLIF